MPGQVVDVRMQHPTLSHLNHQLFESLRRSMSMAGGFEQEIPLEATIAAMDETNLWLGLAAAWYSAPDRDPTPSA